MLRFGEERSKAYLYKAVAHYEKNHFFLKLSVWSTATAYPVALFVSLVFWSFLFNYNKKYDFDVGGYLNLSSHLFQVSQVFFIDTTSVRGLPKTPNLFTFQTIIALVDTFVSSRPWRLWHCWCPILFGAAYLIFNILYVVVFDGTNTKGEDFVYDVLQWNENPGMSALFVVVSMVVIPVLFSVFYFEAKLRDRIWAKWYQGFDLESEDADNVASLNNSRVTGVYTISIRLKDGPEKDEVIYKNVDDNS